MIKSVKITIKRELPKNIPPDRKPVYSETFIFLKVSAGTGLSNRGNSLFEFKE
jgi:hypothetical protein